VSQVNQLERQRKDNEELIAKRDMALKLFTNREFKKLILDGFCLEDCARYAQLSSDPSLNAEQRADSLGLAQAAGHLRRYLSVVVQMGHRGEAENAKVDEAINEARLEEAEEEALAAELASAGADNRPETGELQ
jgi:hypothetical protein